jgi:hypothetical protein
MITKGEVVAIDGYGMMGYGGMFFGLLLWILQRKSMLKVELLKKNLKR